MRNRALGLLVCGMLTLSACSDEPGYSADDVLGVVEKYLGGEFGLCQTNSLGDLQKGNILDAFLRNCHVRSASENDGDFTVELSVPDYAKIEDMLEDDAHFAKIKDDPEQVMKYYCTVMENDEVHKDISWNVAWDGTCLSDSSVLCDAAVEILDAKVCYKEDERALENGSSFVFKIGESKVLVSDLEVISGERAMEQLYLAGSANKKYGESDNVFFVRYKVTNLSEGSVHVPSLFSVVCDGKLVKNTSEYVGLMQEADLGNLESADLTAFMAGPGGSSVYFLYKGYGKRVIL